MLINNIISSYKSEQEYEGVRIVKSGWRSNELKSKVIELRLQEFKLKDIAELLSITSNTAATWCREILGREKALAISDKIDGMARAIRSQDKEARKLKIIYLLKSDPVLTVLELAKKLSVSIVTIRSNLKEIRNNYE